MAGDVASRREQAIWAGWVVGALLLLPLTGDREWVYLSCVAGSALVLALVARGGIAKPGVAAAASDLPVIAALYVGVVALMRLAFVGFGTDRTAGLFLCFAAALLLGVVGPVAYTVWTRAGSLGDLGISREGWRTTAVLAVAFAVTQFGITLVGYSLPRWEDWVPLLVMALVVGVFESVFFRGFVQTRLEARYGSPAGIAGAAVLYGGYHVGYGMGLADIVFLTGLGLTYAVAFALARNLLVLWPLLSPLGSFYAQVDNGDIDLPWASILGFADVAVVMGVALWLARRHERGRAARADQSARVIPPSTASATPDR